MATKYTNNNSKRVPEASHTRKIKIFDLSAGKNIVILDDQDAEGMDMFVGDRIEIKKGKKTFVGIIDTSKELVKKGEIGLYSDTAKTVGLKNGDVVEVVHLPSPIALEYIKKKMDRGSLTAKEIHIIVQETVDNKLSEGELASFVAGAYINGFSIEETVSLARAMVDTGETLDINVSPIADKHSIGGVAGNRTTMIIVPILAAAGVYIPKTSSRAITSASGTADTFEVLAPVVLPIDDLRRVVKKTKGCIVWGGAINLAPVDDKLIRIRHSLHIDPKGLMLASILGKKKAVGAKYLVIDIPIGRGAKIQSETEGNKLARDFVEIGERLGMKTRVLVTDGSDPIGFGVGPSLECIDVFNALTGNGPVELLQKSTMMAGSILEMVGKARVGKGTEMAFNIVKNGKAMSKLREIIGAQGGNPKVKIDDLPMGQYRYEVPATKSGRIQHVDNKSISKVARAAGSPKDKGAGIILHCESGDKCVKGQLLFEIVAESETKLSFAIRVAEAAKPVEMQRMVFGRIE